MTKKTAAISMLLLWTTAIFSQLPKGSWREHLPYTNGHTLALSKNRVYCATEKALFYYDKIDGRLVKQSKVNGLSDLEPGYIAYSKTHEKLLVGYVNGNIDLFVGDEKFNFPDIKIKNIMADKAIYHMQLYGNSAYISCGFGIVVFNLEKEEISDSYIIGSGGTYKKITSTAIFNDSIFATTEKGIYKAGLNDPFLGNFENWSLVGGLVNPDGSYFSALAFDNKLYVVNNKLPDNNTRICEYDGITWDTILTQLNFVKNLALSEGKLTIAKQYHVYTFGENLEQLDVYSAHNAQHCLYDPDGNLWLADSKEGLLLKKPDVYKSVLAPDGPVSNRVFDLFYNNNSIMVAPGGRGRTGKPVFYEADVFEFYNESWSSLLETNYDSINYVRDVICIAATNPGTYYAGTWGYGLIEVADRTVKKVWNFDNTEGVLGNFISGCTYDRKGNLWIVNRLAERPFVVKTAAGNWYNYAYNGAFSNKMNHKVICTRQNTLWAVSQAGDGVFVWNANGTPEVESDDDYVHFSIRQPEKILSNEVYDIVEDKEGTIWLGTTNGVVVYDAPERIFNESIIYARTPQLVVDGYLKDLLEGEVVTSIAVDGANRKWLGTEGGGLFLVSADGTEEILVWNVDNSKLLSNNIIAIEINQQTGEVFIGTDKGLQSFMGTATEAKSSFSQIYAFPNPVKEGYNGTITIRGLMYQTQVKITDLAGHLVYETISNGGDAVWNGKDMRGGDVQSGIYLVLCTTPTGEVSEATKLLIVK